MNTKTKAGWLGLLLLTVAPVCPKQRQELLFEHVPVHAVEELLEARFPRLRLVAHPTMNGCYVQPSDKPAALEKKLIPALDQPPLSGAGTSTREYRTIRVPASAWTTGQSTQATPGDSLVLQSQQVN
jgi:hypothetical protein